jgi:hypothetical protein
MDELFSALDWHEASPKREMFEMSEPKRFYDRLILGDLATMQMAAVRP